MPKTSRSFFSASARRLATLAGLGHAVLARASSSRTVPSMALRSQSLHNFPGLPAAAFITHWKAGLQ